MPERKKEVRTFQVTMSCEKCGAGEMQPTGVALMSNPAQYPHRCDQCGHAQSFERTYPYIAYQATPSSEELQRRMEICFSAFFQPVREKSEVSAKSSPSDRPSD